MDCYYNCTSWSHTVLIYSFFYSVHVPWGELSMGRVVHGASCPWGELSMGRNVPGAKCPWGELSMGRDVCGAKCLWGEMSVGWNVCGARCRGASCCGASFRGASCPGASCLGASGPGTAWPVPQRSYLSEISWSACLHDRAHHPEGNGWWDEDILQHFFYMSWVHGRISEQKMGPHDQQQRKILKPWWNPDV